MASHNDIGRRGESLAADYLVEAGFILLEKNWTYGKAEVDIIAQKDNILCVVEVKTRSQASIMRPENSVNRKKIQLLMNAIDCYVQTRNLDVQVRFDIIAIVGNNGQYSIDHIEDAFYHFS